jgi:hypothetical protein
MYKKFLLSGVCCAVLSWSGVVSGMEIEANGKIEGIETRAQNESAEVSLVPIALGFPVFVGGNPDLTPSEWHRMFKHISGDVEFLLANAHERDKVLDASGAVRVFPHTARCSFQRFADSDLFDQVTFNRVLAFLRLFPLVRRELLDDQSQYPTFEALVAMVDNIQYRRKPFFSSNDYDLIEGLSDMVDSVLQAEYDEEN